MPDKQQHVRWLFLEYAYYPISRLHGVGVTLLLTSALADTPVVAQNVYWDSPLILHDLRDEYRDLDCVAGPARPVRTACTNR